MDLNDPYINSRLLYKCDRNVASIYQNILRMSMGEKAASEQVITEIDNVIFQNFKYQSALRSLQNDHRANELAQEKADIQIEKTKAEIKSLNDQVKTAQLIRRRKMEFNELVQSIKKFETNEELKAKISNVEQDIKDLETAYEEEMNTFQEKQRCLRIALSALNIFLGNNSQNDEIIPQ